MEPDHAACIEEIVLRYPRDKIICTQKAFLFMNQFSYSMFYSNNNLDVNVIVAVKYYLAGEIMENEYYQIEEVAVKTGLTKRAIRYYEDIGLIKPIRTESSYRLYTEEGIEKISRIKKLRDNLGFSLSEVGDIFELELSIQKVFTGKDQKRTSVDSAIASVKEQLKLIEEKEKTLKNLKDKCIEALEELQEL